MAWGPWTLEKVMSEIESLMVFLLLHGISNSQLCLTLCDPMDCSPLGSSVHGILQARILEWVAMPSSRGSSRSRDRTWVSCIAGRFFMVWATREEFPLINSSAWLCCPRAILGVVSQAYTQPLGYDGGQSTLVAAWCELISIGASKVMSPISNIYSSLPSGLQSVCWKVSWSPYGCSLY